MDTVLWGGEKNDAENKTKIKLFSEMSRCGTKELRLRKKGRRWLIMTSLAPAGGPVLL